MTGAVMAVFTTGFLLGVSWRSLYLVPFSFIVWLLFIALALALLMGWVKNRRMAFLISLWFLSFAVGIIRTDIYTWRFDDSPLMLSLNQNVALEGVVWREPEYKEKQLRLIIKVDNDLVLATTNRLQKVDYGDKIVVAGKLTAPKNFTTDLGREFNYRNYLQAQKINYLINFAQVEVIDRGHGNFIFEKIFSVKKAFMESVQNTLPPPASGLGLGLLLGVKSALGDETETNFRRSGLTHIVVLSGYNVMLVVAFISALLSHFLSRTIRVGISLLAIILFAFLVGLSATVVRASIMASLVLLAHNWGRDYNVWRSLWLTGMIMILFNPFLFLFDIGFQLSFMATIGLITVAPTLESTFIAANSSQKIIDWQSFLRATIATQAAVLPLLMYYIGEVSLVAVLANILVLPVIPLAMMGTFLVGLFSFWESLSGFIGYGTFLVLNYILVVAENLSNLTFATITLPQLSFWWVWFLYLLAVAFLWFFYRKQAIVIAKGGNDMSGWKIETEEKVINRLKNRVNRLNGLDDNLPKFFR